MESNYQRTFDLMIVHEGGYVNDPHDPGGATNLGVTQATLSAWLGHKAKISEVKALTKATVCPIYKQNYWDKLKGDRLPAGLDYTVFDFGVNSGPKRAAMALQRAINVADDGIIGAITLEAVDNREPTNLINLVCNDRLNFLHKLSTWSRYGKGWGRRVEEVRKAALQMANQGVV